MTPEQAEALAKLLTEHPNEQATVAYYTESGDAVLEQGYVLATFTGYGTFSITADGRVMNLTTHFRTGGS